jgi:hypothetical protein
MRNNGIFSRRKLIFSSRTKPQLSRNLFNGNEQKKHLRERDYVSAYEDKLVKKIQNSKIIMIILGPKYFGVYPSHVMIHFSNYLDFANIPQIWLEIEEGQSISFHNEVLLDLAKRFDKFVFMIDPLAAPEIFPQYRKIEDYLYEFCKFPEQSVVAAWLGDIWREKDKRQIMECNSFVDLFFHLDSVASLTYPANVRKKMYFYPMPAFDIGLFKPNLSKSMQIVFSGQIRDADRRKLIREEARFAARFGIPFLAKTWYKWDGKNVLDEFDYAQFLNGSKVCLSLTQKGRDHWILPGRTLQAIQSECLLLHQEGSCISPLSEFLIPYKHYLPFTNLEELSSHNAFISKNPDQVLTIAQSARLEFKDSFPESVFWQPILELFESY